MDNNSWIKDEFTRQQSGGRILKAGGPRRCNVDLIKQLLQTKRFIMTLIECLNSEQFNFPEISESLNDLAYQLNDLKNVENSIINSNEYKVFVCEFNLFQLSTKGSE